jgi:outer membrane lipopolysaccharide assembly protein LptE/RlpB
MKRTATLLLVLLAACAAGCGGCPYSFTGASVPPHINTIAIPIFDDQSGFGDPSLRDIITSQVTRRFEQDGNLRIAERNDADSILDGVITAVRDEIAVVEGGADRASVRRVTVTVRIQWQDMVNRELVLDTNVSEWGEYDVAAAGPAQRQVAIEEAVRKLADEILLATVARW